MGRLGAAATPGDNVADLPALCGVVLHDVLPGRVGLRRGLALGSRRRRPAAVVTTPAQPLASALARRLTASFSNPPQL